MYFQHTILKRIGKKEHEQMHLLHICLPAGSIGRVATIYGLWLYGTQQVAYYTYTMLDLLPEAVKKRSRLLKRSHHYVG